MKKILVFSEFQNGSLKNGSLELLSYAANTGGEVTALVLNPEAKSQVDELAKYGAKKAILCTDDSFKNYNAQVFTNMVTKAISEHNPEVVLASSTSLARDLFPRVATRLNTGVTSDCTGLEITDQSVVVKRPLYSGKCTAEVEFKNSPHKLILMRANQLPQGKPDHGATIDVTEMSPESCDLTTILKEVVKGTSEKLDLTEANIIVSGGRGLKSKENFKLLEDLASVLGATVGASRAVVDAGWVPHTMQVGQTGKTVAPSLYIACGISGAIQHLAGMSGSKIVVAINSDPEAPIFQKSTYGIVGDVFEVVPKLTEAFKEVL